jgi:hypothetical protein
LANGSGVAAGAAAAPKVKPPNGGGAAAAAPKVGKPPPGCLVGVWASAAAPAAAPKPGKPPPQPVVLGGLRRAWTLSLPEAPPLPACCCCCAAGCWRPAAVPGAPAASGCDPDPQEWMLPPDSSLLRSSCAPAEAGPGADAAAPGAVGADPLACELVVAAAAPWPLSLGSALSGCGALAPALPLLAAAAPGAKNAVDLCRLPNEGIGAQLVRGALGLALALAGLMRLAGAAGAAPMAKATPPVGAGGAPGRSEAAGAALPKLKPSPAARLGGGPELISACGAPVGARDGRGGLRADWGADAGSEWAGPGARQRAAP